MSFQIMRLFDEEIYRGSWGILVKELLLHTSYI